MNIETLFPVADVGISYLNNPENALIEYVYLSSLVRP